MRGRSSRAARPTWSSFTATRSPIPPRSGASGGCITAACGSADRSGPERPPPLGFGRLVAFGERAVDRRLRRLSEMRDPADALGDGRGVERDHRLLACEGPSHLYLAEQVAHHREERYVHRFRVSIARSVTRAGDARPMT